TSRSHARIKLDLTECALVPTHILLQQSQQRFRLLWAQIDALEILDLDLSFGLLLQRAENQKEIPDVDPHLHAIGIVLAVRGVIYQFDVRLARKAHGWKCNDFAVGKGSWAGKIPPAETAMTKTVTRLMSSAAGRTRFPSENAQLP